MSGIARPISTAESVESNNRHFTKVEIHIYLQVKMDTRFRGYDDIFMAVKK
ncbi:MAG TPA: hypothetical protein VJM47_10070 [Nitrosospira sp.]|nr:hypothetical protein [Nitrosospira sp.]